MALKVGKGANLPEQPTWTNRFEAAWGSTKEIVGKVWL